MRLPSGPAVAVRRVRFSATDHDQVGEQVHLGRLLAAASVRPGGLPPPTILLVRRLRDPLPGTLRLAAGYGLPPARWERAFALQLGEARRRAARPAAGPVSPDAEAVLFADRAELLAALALDHVRGVAHERWWWRLLGAVPGGRQTLATALATEPETVPAMFELLTQSGDAGRVVLAFSESEAAHMLAEVRRAHALPSPTTPGVATGRSLEQTEHGPPIRELRPPPAPWADAVPEANDTTLSPARAELLGVSLLLRRRPAQARSLAFTRAAARWRAAVSTQLPNAANDPADTQPSTAPAHAHTHVPRQPPAESGRSRPALSAASLADEPELTTARSPAPTTVGETSAPTQQQPSLAHTVVPDPASAEASEPQPEPPQVEPAAPVPPVSTGLGGVFYLLNVGLELGLYRDFTTPETAGIALNPWDFAALLGARLLASPRPDDRVWAVLAELAGRSVDEQPGAGFRPPRAWRLPQAWTSPFDNQEPLSWHATDGRLVLQHAKGFPVVDVPRHGALAEQLARELCRRRARAVASGRPGAIPPHQPLARWATWVEAYLRARVGIALDATDPETLSHRLLEHQAEVHLSPTRVDVVLRLAELPIEIRVAGLDRTPGWIPAAGRHLAFHFE
jgi:hypothetical protein